MSNESFEVKEYIVKLRKWWAASLGIIVALVIGIFFGIALTERKILSDCKYINNFRIDNNGFSCTRKV